MGRNKSAKALEIAGRKVSVAQLFLQGESQVSIAEQLGLSRATIQRDLAQLKAEWLDEAAATVDHAQSLELQRLANLEREAWRAFTSSKQPKEPGGPARDGNAKFLDIVLRCIARRSAILGLDKPVKIAPTTPDGSEITEDYREALEKLPREQLMALAAARRALAEKRTGQQLDDFAKRYNLFDEN